MRESLREERTLWVTDQIARDKFPEDLEAFYLLKNAPSEEKPPAEEDGDKKGKVTVAGVCLVRDKLCVTRVVVHALVGTRVPSRVNL